MNWFQSNSESALIEQIHSSIDKVDWIIINAAGYTHTSVALRDALSMFPGGVIEVHISNIHTRESFRHTSLISGIANECDCWLWSSLLLYGYRCHSQSDFGDIIENGNSIKKKSAAKKATSDNDAKLVKDLAKILDETGLAELVNIKQKCLRFDFARLLVLRRLRPFILLLQSDKHYPEQKRTSQLLRRR